MHPGHAAALSILVITKLAGPQQVTAGELVSTGSIGLASGQVYRGIALARQLAFASLSYEGSGNRVRAIANGEPA